MLHIKPGRGDRRVQGTRSRCVARAFPWLIHVLATDIGVGWLLNVPATCGCISETGICSDNFTCCHTEIEVADPTFHLTQSQYTDTGPTSPSTDPITPDARQGSHWSVNFEVTGMTRPREISRRKRDSNPESSSLQAGSLTTRPTRRLQQQKTRF